MQRGSIEESREPRRKGHREGAERGRRCYKEADGRGKQPVAPHPAHQPVAEILVKVPGIQATQLRPELEVDGHAFTGDANLAAELVAGTGRVGLVGLEVGRPHHPRPGQEHAKRDVDIVEQALWNRPVVSAADGEKGAVGANHRAGRGLEAFAPLVERPERAPDRGHGGFAGIDVGQVGADAADSGIGEVAPQDRDGRGVDANVSVSEHDDRRRGPGHEEVHAMRLAAALGRDDESDPVPVRCQDLGRAITRRVHIDRDLESAIRRLAQAQEVLDLLADDRGLVVDAQADREGVLDRPDVGRIRRRRKSTEAAGQQQRELIGAERPQRRQRDENGESGEERCDAHGLPSRIMRARPKRGPGEPNDRAGGLASGASAILGHATSAM